MSLSEYFTEDRIDALEKRVSALEEVEKQTIQIDSCKHDGGFMQMPNAGVYQKCRKCGIAIDFSNNS